MKIKNIKAISFIKNLTKAYTEGVYADTPANRKLGRVGISYKEWTQKQQDKKEVSIIKEKLTEEQFDKILNKLGWNREEIEGNSFKEKRDNFFEGKTEEETKEIIDEGLSLKKDKFINEYNKKRKNPKYSYGSHKHKAGSLSWYPIKTVQGIQISGRKDENGKIIEYSIGNIKLKNTPENKEIIDNFKKGKIDSFIYLKDNKKYKVSKVEDEFAGQKYFKMIEKEIK